MRPKLFTAEEIKEHLASLKSWQRDGASIQKEFGFKDFKKAFAFMTLAAFEAEKLNHHPDWKNVYNRVSVTLSTHDAGGLTELDFKLAALMDKIFEDGF